MTNAIELAKHTGACNALRDRIETLRHNLTNNNWSGIACATNYTRLGEAIADARKLLNEMEETLAALKEMEPANR